MQLHEVDVIQELFSVRDVNEALKQGWRIVAVTSSAETNSGDSPPVACYVLGRQVKPVAAPDASQGGWKEMQS